MINRSKTLFRFLKTDELFRDSSIMMLATILTGGMNYLYQVYVGRALGPADFGAFGALFAISYLLSILGQGITFSTAHFTSKFEGEKKNVRGFYHGMLLRSGLIGLAVFVFIVFLSPVLSSFLNIEDSILLVVVALNFFLGMLMPVTMGVVQGLQHFKALGAYQIASALLKLISGVLLVRIGYGVLGALGAVVIATLLITLFSTYHAQRLTGSTSRKAMDMPFAKVYKFGFSSLLVAFCFTVPANMDVVLVKHFFTSAEAGLYTSATVLAKILIFLPMGISVALFPKISKTRAMHLPTEPLLYKALVYVGALSGTGTLAYMLVPELVIRLLFGSTYLASAPLVRWYGVAVFFFSLIVVLMNYHLANHSTRFIHLTVFLTLMEILLILILHNTLIQVISIIITINIITLIVGLTGVKKHAIHHRPGL